MRPFVTMVRRLHRSSGVLFACQWNHYQQLFFPWVQNLLRKIHTHRSQAVGEQKVTLITQTAAGGTSCFVCQWGGLANNLRVSVSSGQLQPLSPGAHLSNAHIAEQGRQADFEGRAHSDPSLKLTNRTLTSLPKAGGWTGPGLGWGKWGSVAFM